MFSSCDLPNISPARSIRFFFWVHLPSSANLVYRSRTSLIHLCSKDPSPGRRFEAFVGRSDFDFLSSRGQPLRQRGVEISLYLFLRVKVLRRSSGGVMQRVRSCMMHLFFRTTLAVFSLVALLGMLAIFTRCSTDNSTR